MEELQTQDGGDRQGLRGVDDGFQGQHPQPRDLSDPLGDIYADSREDIRGERLVRDSR